MAPEIATIKENQHGTAFEVKIKKPTTTAPAVRSRLESYVRRNAGPGAGDRGSATCAKRAEMRADKARKMNQQKKEVVQKLRVNLAHSTDTKRTDLAQQLEKAQELREGALSDRKQRAAQHYEKVMQKKDDTQQQVLMTTAEAKERLAGALAQKETLRGHCLAEITNRAVKHNEKVAQKVQAQQEVQEKKRLESKELPAEERLMNLSLRLYEHHLVACPH